MATNADFNALIVRITTATNTLETDVATINEGASDIDTAVIAAQAAATQAGTSATTATTQAGNAAASATAAQALVTALEAAVVIEEAPVDGNTYGRNNAAWVEITAGGGAVDSVNGQTGVVVLTAANVGAKPSSYVPTWAEVTGKPTTFAPIIGTTSTTALAGNTVIPTNTNQLTNGANFITTAGAPVQSVAGKTGTVVLAAADIASGVMAPARLGTGTPSSTTVLLGDGTWGSAPASGGWTVPTFKYKGTNISTWPLTNPFESIWIGDCANTAGTVSGAALFASTSATGALPAGKYVFRSADFATGNLSGQLGFIHLDYGEVATGNFQRRAWAYIQSTGSVGNMYVLKSDGTWNPV